MGNNAQSVMLGLQKLAEERGTLNWETWLQAATKLNALLQVEEDRLAEMEHQLVRTKAELVAGGMKPADAKLQVESSELALAVAKQQSLVKRANETIMLAKKFAQLSSDTYRAM